MTSPRSASRRRTLQWLAGAPLFPLGAGASSQRPTAAADLQRVEFVSMPAPTLDQPAEMARVSVASHLVAHDSSGRTQRWALAYEPFFVTGDQVPDNVGQRVVAGGCYGANLRPLIDDSIEGQARQFFSNNPDGMSLIQLEGVRAPGVKGHTVFAVVQFEATSRDLSGRDTWGRMPSPVAVLTLDQDAATGRLRLVRYQPVDTTAVHGLWVTCGASLSPWNTHLASEEYEPDATLALNPYLRDFSRHQFGDPSRANPYHYGHLPEITVMPDGSGRVRKHYGLGRISRELVQVMPDERSVLMGDDTTNGGLFFFVADRPRDLSSGTLYVARWHQTSGQGPGAATLSWVKLGHARSAQIEALIDRGLRAADILDVHTRDPGEPGYTRIPFGGRVNWVRLKPGMAQAAAFLETHRYAALMGGSMGFTKMEGTTVNARDRVAYTAISRIDKSMLDGSGDIRVEGPYSGAVYALNLRGGLKDTGGQDIDSAWVPTDMAPVPALISEDLGGGKRRAQDALGNFAHPDKISQPDNLKFSEALRVLFIGEDSNTHVNNFLWAYHVDTGVLSRLLSCPAGAESTGLHAVDAINGWTYVMSNFQHAGDFDSALHRKVRDQVEPLIRANYRDGYGAAVGYLTGVASQPRPLKPRAGPAT